MFVFIFLVLKHVFFDVVYYSFILVLFMFLLFLTMLLFLLFFICSFDGVFGLLWEGLGLSGVLLYKRKIIFPRLVEMLSSGLFKLRFLLCLFFFPFLFLLF